MLEWLLDQPDIDSKATDDHGHDVFGMAVKQNNFRAAQILIERNPDFDINQRSKQDRILTITRADGPGEDYLAFIYRFMTFFQSFDPE